jgi:hypothetical protein
VGAFHAEPPEADIETSSKSNISLRCRMSAWSPYYRMLQFTPMTKILVKAAIRKANGGCRVMDGDELVMISEACVMSYAAHVHVSIA